MAYSYKKITDIEDLCGKRVLLRLDFNVPIEGEKEGEKVRDDYRIRKSLKTIDFLRHAGAKVIILSHIESESQTLKPVFNYFTQTYPEYHLKFVEKILENGKEAIANLKDGGVLLAENIRLYAGEKKNDPIFSKELAALGDIYINDAFSVSHRSHASVVGIPQYIPGFAGFQFTEEVEHIARSFSPTHPFLFVLGGAKFDTKLPLITKFVPLADSIFVGGALAHNFYKEAGESIGTSLFSSGFYNTDELVKSNKIVLPKDFVLVDDVEKGKEAKNVILGQVPPSSHIADAGSETLKNLETIISKASFIVWNGPLGNYENGYTQATKTVASMIAARTRESRNTDNPVYSLVGGGDTLAAIASLGLEQDFSFVSTGGGAMLDLLANETLPGISALEKTSNK